MLSLSVRIAEGFLSKEEAVMDLPTLVRLARAAGYQALCMRASQLGVHSPAEAVAEGGCLVSDQGLKVTMVTGDFAVVYNNERGPNCLQGIAPYLDLAEALGAGMIRVAMKQDDDIPAAQKAADEARERGIRLVHQCHTLSLFETVDSIEATLRRVNRPNFGLIFEPANLEICGQDYGRKTIQRLAPWIFNVYFQNQRLHDGGSITLDTWCRGPVSFDLLSVHDPGGIDFPSVLENLREIDYQGPITVHQSARDGETPADSASKTAQYLSTLTAS